MVVKAPSDASNFGHETLDEPVGEAAVMVTGGEGEQSNRPMVEPNAPSQADTARKLAARLEPCPLGSCQ